MKPAGLARNESRPGRMVVDDDHVGRPGGIGLCELELASGDVAVAVASLNLSLGPEQITVTNECSPKRLVE